MNFERSKKTFWIIAAVIISIMIILIIIFIYLMLAQPDIVHKSEIYGSFWLKNFSILIATLAFASSALAAAYNALEQRHLRYMENYPYLEIFQILSVDPLPSPVPKHDVLPELSTFNKDYLKKVAPTQPISTSDIEFRYFALAIRNVGNGVITRIRFYGIVEISGIALYSQKFTLDRRFNLPPGETIPVTLVPISGLPEINVTLPSVNYHGYFVELSDYEGKKEFHDEYPFIIPSEQRDTIFFDDFVNAPIGQGWVLDFWGRWQHTPYIHVPFPKENDHFMILSGNEKQFREEPHNKNQGGAFKDLFNIFSYGETAKITARVRSVPRTTAKIQLWCHDIAATPKERYTDAITPGQEWEEISMLYTCTQTNDLRVHLLYTPGEGTIYVDKVLVEGLYT